MNTEEFRALMVQGTPLYPGDEAMEFMRKRADRARRIYQEINSSPYDEVSIRDRLGALTGDIIDQSVTVLPPVTIDSGVNLHFGRDIFVNAGCAFQDQGGIRIGDGALIGHHVVFATLNHDEDPRKRGILRPAAINIEPNVWIGSNATILAGVTIGEGAIVAAGAVVNRTVAPRTVVAGVPAKYIREVVSENA